MIETVFYNDEEVTVEYEYYPPEGDNWNEPYYPATIEITSTKVNGKEVDYSYEELKEIEELVWNIQKDEPDEYPEDYSRPYSWRF